MAYDTGLLAVEYLVVADDVGANVLLLPSHIFGLEDNLELAVESGEGPFNGPAVLAGSAVLSKGYAHAL